MDQELTSHALDGLAGSRRKPNKYCGSRPNTLCRIRELSTWQETKYNICRLKGQRIYPVSAQKPANALRVRGFVNRIADVRRPTSENPHTSCEGGRALADD